VRRTTQRTTVMPDMKGLALSAMAEAEWVTPHPLPAARSRPASVVFHTDDILCASAETCCFVPVPRPLLSQNGPYEPDYVAVILEHYTRSNSVSVFEGAMDMTAGTYSFTNTTVKKP
jgi:hypothetical protein